MKKLIIAPLLLFVLSCGSTKTTTADINKQPVLTDTCPENGDCKIEIMKGSSLVIMQDGMGRPYYRVVENSAKDVVKYTYNLKKASPGTDDFYNEEIIFETASGLSNNAKAEKMLFGVRCYCKGKAGYYHVKNGAINYDGSMLSVAIPPDIIDSQIISGYTVLFK